jgi:Polyketide cyclase / dehydrase and lipid transport
MMTAMGESKGPFGGSSHSSASAEEVWAVWTNPAEWPGGVIATAKIDGPFAVGARITTRVKGYPPLTSTVTRIESPRMWTGVAKAPGLTQTIEHLVEETDSGALLTERTVFTGPLASVAARMLGARLRKTFDATIEHCARLAERNASR